MPIKFENFKWSYCYECLIPLTRFWGVVTPIVLCGVGGDLYIHRKVVGLYITIAAFIILFLEVLWAINLFLQVVFRKESSEMNSCWQITLALQDWKRSFFYAAIALPLIVNSYNLWLTPISGGMLMILACLHLLQAIGTQVFRSRDTLLAQYHSGETCDRFEEIFDDNSSETSPNQTCNGVGQHTQYQQILQLA